MNRKKFDGEKYQKKNEIFKIVVLGANEVGKSSIIKKMKDGKDLDCVNEYIPSSCDIYFTNISLSNQKMDFSLQLWGSCSHYNNQQKNDILFEKAIAAIIVFDLTNRTSFDESIKYIEATRRYNENIIIFFVGNKMDLQSETKVKNDEFKELAERFEAEHFKLSTNSMESINSLKKKIGES